jgi:S1-C subfamily serine protease
MRVSSLAVLTFAALLAAPVGASSQDDVLTLRGPGAHIGATFRDPTTAPASGRAGGALLVEVQEKSPAAMSGMRPGDLVTVFDGIGVRDSRDLRKLIAETPPGRTVSVTIVRDGRARIVKVAPVPGR